MYHRFRISDFTLFDVLKSRPRTAIDNSSTMKPSQVACLLLPVLLGEVRGDYGIQPVDAVLLIDGAPTYLRLTNSTSLETVYSCVLENSQNVNSVVLSSQMRGVQMDVGQVEENVNEVIRFLSGEGESNGRTLWKSPEELKLFKMRLARYLTTNYYDNKPVLEPDTYLNFKSQRSADWLHNNRGHQPIWREQLQEQRRQFQNTALVYASSPNWYMPKSTEIQRISSASTPTAVPIPERTTIPDAVFVHKNIPTTESPPSPKVHTPVLSDTTPNITETGIHPLKLIYEKASPLSVYEYAKIVSVEETTTGEPEAMTIPVEGLFNMEKINLSGASNPMKDVVETDGKPEEKSIKGEEARSLTDSTGGRFNTGGIDPTSPGNVTDDGKKKTSTTTTTTKLKRKNSRKRVAKSRQQSSTTQKANGED